MLPERMVGIVCHALGFQDSGQLWEWVSCSGFRGDISGDGPLAWSDRGRPNRTHTVCSNPGWPCQLRYAGTARPPHGVQRAWGPRQRPRSVRQPPSEHARPRGNVRHHLGSTARATEFAEQGWGPDQAISYPTNNLPDQFATLSLPAGPPCRARLDLVLCYSELVF